MSRQNPRPNAIASGYRCKYRLHPFFAGVHRQPRYATHGAGRNVDSWKGMDAFEIGQGDGEGLVLIYSLRERTARDAWQWLNEHGYTEFVASGRIDARIAEPEWRFEKPPDRELCAAVMCEIVSDPQFLRYFAKFYVVAPDAHRFGQANSFCVPDDDKD